MLLIEGVCAPEPDLPFPPIADLEASAQLRRQIAELPSIALAMIEHTWRHGSRKAVSVRVRRIHANRTRCSLS